MKIISERNSKSRAFPQLRIKLGSGFILLFALIYFFDISGFLASLLPVVLAHEAGHVLAMLVFGAYPTCLNATLAGFSIDYSGDINELKEMLTALAGPVFGLLFAVLCSILGKYMDSDFLLMCAGLGFVINFFNLLPAKPLDGGRVLEFALNLIIGAKYAQIALRLLGLLIAISLLACGLFFIAKGYGFSLFLAGIWLFILQQNKSCK